MKDLTIAIPLGVSTPGTPVLRHLKKCVDSIKNQKTNYSCDIMFACDENVSEEIKNYLESTNCFIKWYDPFYFFRKGSIWKKIFDQWVNSDSKYIAFCHYDDIWHENKIQTQISFMENNNYDLSWSSVYVINEEDSVVSNDVACYTELNRHTITQPQSYAFSHSSMMNKDKFLKTGIMDVLNESSRIYEEVHFVFCHKLVGKKSNDSIFYHRNHSNSISSNFNKDSEIIDLQRKLTNYSLQEEWEDARKINIKKIITEIQTTL